ncbi:MAG: FAD-dependent oxidoreductase, partial [Candidatus Hinthialibacter sp.]
MTVDAVIIGGGFAGLAAAASLARRGAKVLLVEKKTFPGGRVYSIRDRRTGDWIDNGQHALMGCYHQTFDLLREWGTEDGVFLQPRIEILYRGADGLRDRLRGYPLPGPLHLLGGLLSMRSFTGRDKWAAMRFGLQMKRPNAVKPGETVEQLCDRLGQPAAVRRRMWGA